MSVFVKLEASRQFLIYLRKKDKKGAILCIPAGTESMRLNKLLLFFQC